MKTILKLEETAMFVFSIFIFSKMNLVWWWFPALLLAPDLSMMGYLVNSKIGAWCYNLAHHKGIALAVFFLGIYLGNTTFQLSGLILFAHSSMDRMMGYGLKYNDNFQNTHLGIIGKSK
jgi:hypothetical protein